MEDEGMSGTTLIMLKNVRGIIFAIDGLATRQEDGEMRQLGDKKIQVLSPKPYYLSCMLSGSSPNCRKAVKSVVTKNNRLFEAEGRRMTVKQFAESVVEFWVAELGKEGNEKTIEDKNSTVAIGGYDGIGVGGENVCQMWAAEYKPPNPPSKFEIVEDYFFSGSGKDLAKLELESYTVEMTMAEVTRRVKAVVMATSRPYPPNENDLELPQSGGQTNIRLINSDNDFEIHLTAKIDDIIDEMIKLCDLENIELEKKKKREEEEGSGGSGSSSSKGKEEKGNETRQLQWILLLLLPEEEE